MNALRLFPVALLLATAWGASQPSKSAASTGKVVPHERLQALLPQLPGWTRGNVQGETVVEDTPISRIQVSYEKGESSLSFEIMDTAKNKDLLAELRLLIKPGYSEKRDNGYTKATEVRRFPATEEWTNEARNGYISVLVAERFVVKVTGEYVPNVDTIRKAVEAVDLEKLAALK
jgi:hypothetical protein